MEANESNSKMEKIDSSQHSPKKNQESFDREILEESHKKNVENSLEKKQKQVEKLGRRQEDIFLKEKEDDFRRILQNKYQNSFEKSDFSKISDLKKKIS